MAEPRRTRVTKTVQKKLRAALEAEREQLVNQMADLDAEADVTNWRDGGFDDDPADSGSANIERERAQSLSLHARRIVERIDTALERIDDGTYGVCDRCGKPIQKPRLEAIPYADLCVDCKRLDESGR